MSDVHDEAIETLRENDAERQKLAGKQVRVVRAVVYQGKFEDVDELLSNSLPEGVHRNHRDGLTTRIVQGKMKIIE